VVQCDPEVHCVGEGEQHLRPGVVDVVAAGDLLGRGVELGGDEVAVEPGADLGLGVEACCRKSARRRARTAAAVWWALIRVVAMALAQS